MVDTNGRVEREAQFEEIAQRILVFLKSKLRYGNGFLPRPFMIEFTGPPSSGKTTTIREMYDFLRPLGFTVWRPQEGAEWIQHIPRTTPEYNIRTGLYALEKLMDESYGHKYDIILFDRCIFDAYCWMEYWAEKGKLSPGDKSILQQFFTMPFFVNKLDICYFMICQAETALKRQLRVAISARPRETTTIESISNKTTIWRRVYGIQHAFHPHIRLVDTTSLTELEMIDHIGMDILTTLQAKTVML